MGALVNSLARVQREVARLAERAAALPEYHREQLASALETMNGMIDSAMSLSEAKATIRVGPVTFSVNPTDVLAKLGSLSKPLRVIKKVSSRK